MSDQHFRVRHEYTVEGVLKSQRDYLEKEAMGPTLRRLILGLCTPEEQHSAGLALLTAVVIMRGTPGPVIDVICQAAAVILKEVVEEGRRNAA